MQVQEVKFDPILIQGPAYDHGEVRSSGLHLSTIYQDIENTFITRNEMDPEELAFFRAGGFLWERSLSQAFASSVTNGDWVRPGEWHLDGIIGSPDLLDLPRWRVIETKCTWKSSRRLDALEKNFWVWLVQIKGYCRMVGTQEALLLAFHINGDYRGSGPLVRAIELKFTQNEIEQNWRMITNHARKKGWIK